MIRQKTEVDPPLTDKVRRTMRYFSPRARNSAADCRKSSRLGAIQNARPFVSVRQIIVTPFLCGHCANLYARRVPCPPAFYMLDVKTPIRYQRIYSMTF